MDAARRQAGDPYGKAGISARRDAISAAGVSGGAVVAAASSAAEVWKWLGEIADPEIPVLSITDLGIVRGVSWDGEHDELTVTITPTYSGCPAMDVISDEIRRAANEHGVAKLKLVTQ